MISSSLTANHELANDGSMYLTGGGSLEVLGNASNSGTLSLGTSGFGGNGKAYIHGDLNNQYDGLVHLDSGSQLEVNGTLNNYGSVELDRSSLIAGDISNFGTIQALASELGGSSLTITGGLFNGGSGSFLLNGGHDTVTIGSGGIYNSGMIDLENASTLTVNRDVYSENLFFTGFKGQGGNVLNITGTLNNDMGGNLFLQGPSHNATIGSIQNQGIIDLENGSTLRVNGDVRQLRAYFFVRERYRRKRDNHRWHAL